MWKTLLTFVGLITLASTANAAQISAFSQTSGNNTVFGTANGTDTATSLNVTDAQINISQLFGNVTPIIADFSLTANSIDAAQTVLGLAVQHYSGTFCLTSAAGCGGINFLSGTFSDAAVGALGGPGLVVNVNNPPDQLTLSSSVITASELAPPNTFNLGFSNLIPNLSICGSTLCTFSASFAGDISANAVEVVEPMSLAVMGMGLFGLGMIRGKKGLFPNV